jgi:hypothetical protein
MKTFQQFLYDTNEAIEYVTGDETHKGYAADHGGGNYHDHVAFKDEKTRKAAQEYLKKMGWEIGSTTGGKHASNSYHYSGQAFDIPMYRPSKGGVQQGFSDDKIGERAMSARLRADLIKGGFGGGALDGSAKSTPSAPSAPSGTKGSLDAPTQTRVLAKFKGKSGELDKTTGKFTARDWSNTEGSRYKAFGGKDSSPANFASSTPAKPSTPKPAAKPAAPKPVAKPISPKPAAKPAPAAISPQKSSKTA